jgi:hypothetical protein
MMIAKIEPPGPITGELLSMVACLNGPNVRANESAIRTMLSSLTFSAPEH